MRTRGELRDWLAAHHGRPDSIWLVTWKKGSPHHLPYDAIVEEALCFGWIDSLPRRLDAERTMVRLSPRKPGSAWSKANRDRVARLAEAGLIMPAGQAKIDAAIADGAWDRLKGAETGEAPADLRAALEAAGALAGWADFTLATRKRLLENLGAAKRPETRAKRIAAIVAGARDGTDPLAWQGRER